MRRRAFMTVMRRRGPTFQNVTTFTQVAGPAELLTNGNFATWTDDNPDSWGVADESGSDPMVTQVAPDGSAGTGAARFVSTATSNRPYLFQAALPMNAIIEGSVTMSARTAGVLSVGGQNGNNFATNLAAAGERQGVVYNKNHATLLVQAAGGLPYDFVVDNVSVKTLTLNAAIVSKADGTFEFQFALPASPVLGQGVHLVYRVEAANDEFVDCWDAWLERAATTWLFRLDSIAAGTRTTRTTASGITGSPTLIKVVASGNDHTCYTGTGTIDAPTYTQAGSLVTNALYATADIVNTVYSSAVTPGRLKIP